MEGRYIYDTFNGARGVASNGNGDFGDWRISLGIEFPLGRTRTITKTNVIYKTKEVRVTTPVVDSDNDGVPDKRDQCPGTPQDAKVDAHGCLIANQSLVLHNILFELNSFKLTASSQGSLAKVASSLKQQEDLKIEVAGYTDSSGSASYNQQLSQQRAQSVRDYLVTQGVNADHLTVKGYGEKNPIADNSTLSGRAMNRRVELHLSK